MYRIKLRRTADGLGLVLSARDVARLCLAEGDELVVAEVIRTPAYQPEGADGDLFDAPATPAEPAALPLRAGEAPRPRAPTLSDRPDQTELDKLAFRKLAR